MVDYTSYTDQVEFFDEPSNEVKLTAQRVVCGHSSVVDAEDAAELLKILGLHPEQLEVEEWLKAENSWRAKKKGVKTSTLSPFVDSLRRLQY